MKVYFNNPYVAGGTWRLGAKHFFNQRGAHVTAIDFHKETGMLVVGFSNGIFDLFEVRLHAALYAQHTLDALSTHAWYICPCVEPRCQYGAQMP